MNQKGISPIVIILIIVGVLAAAGGIYYFAVQKPNQPEQPVSPAQPEKESVTSTSPEAQPSPTDETTNWQTYRNEEYGFEIKYPENWYIEGGVIPTSELMVGFSNFPSDIEEKENKRIIALIVSEESVIEWLDQMKKFKVEIQEITTNSGIKGYKNVNPIMTLVVLRKDKYMFSLSTETSLDTEKIFNQMLSTFKFIK